MEHKPISLSIRERLLTMMILPQEASYGRLVLIKGIFDKVKFSPEQKTEFNIQETPKGLITDPKFDDKVWEYTFTEDEKELLANILQKANVERTLTFSTMSLFEKFVPKNV